MAPRTPKNAPSTTTALVNIDQKLAEAAGGTAVEKPSGGTKISTKGGKLTYGGTQFPNNEVDVIVLEFAAKNAYYAGAYDPDNVSPPDCFAITQAVWDALEKKRAEARDLLVVPYEPMSEEQKTQAAAPKGRQAAPSGRSARFTAPVAAGKKK